MQAPTKPRRLAAATRRLTVLAVCLGVAATSLAAAGGRAKADPGAAVVAAARAHLKDAYVWGAVGPKAWDCSGLTSSLWQGVGGVRSVPRTAHQQQAWAVPLPAEQVRPGDLAFFGDPVTHVGIIERRLTTKRSGTALTMIDASSTFKGVIERPVWTSGVVRFGRVPRKGMVAVRPWTPAPLPARPVAKPVTKKPDPITTTARGVRLLVGLPVHPRPSSHLAGAAAVRARSYLGSTHLSDVDLVRNAWHFAGGVVLPGSRGGIAAQAAPVAVKDARVGDLVVYGPPASHLGIYVGNGLMVDASRSLGRVVLRKVWAGPSVHLLRLAR